MLRIGKNRFASIAKRQNNTANLILIDSEAELARISDRVIDRLQEAFRSLMIDLKLVSQMPFIETLGLLPSGGDSRNEE